MKNVLILTAITLLFFSCNKEEVLGTSQKKIGDYYTHKLSPTKIIQNLEDPIDTEFKKGLLSLADVMKELLIDDEIKLFIIDEVKKNGKGFISFDKLFLNYPNLKDKVNILLGKSDISKELGISDYDKYVETMIHTDINYIPVINVPNYQNNLNSRNFFISPGIEVEDNDEINIDNNIFSWYFKDGIVNEVSISEKQAMGEQSPLFVITQHMIDEPNTPTNSINNISNSEMQNNKNNANIFWRIKKFKINMRYESSGRSELCVAGAQSSGNTIRGIFSGNYLHSKLLASVPKNKIGQYLYSNMHFLDNNYWGYGSYNLYEEDWFATPKRITYVYHDNYSWNENWVNGKRNYWHEWYLFPEYSNPTNRKQDVASQITTVTKTSSKAYFQFKR